MSSFVPTYRRTGSALHATRTGVAIAYVAALCMLVLVYDHPLVLVAALAAIVLAGWAAGVVMELARAARLALPLALLVVVINPIVSQEGLTVLIEGTTLPLLGRLDVTLEAFIYGCVTGLRVLVLVLAFALYSATVDPDEVLRLAGRLSLRSSLTASLATRLVPVLGRDAERLADAYACRSVRPVRSGRFRRLRRGAILTRALAAGALERAVELAAALEVRGYAGTPRLAGSGPRMPWSRVDLVFFASAVATGALAVAGLVADAGSFDPYPTLHADPGPQVGVLAVTVVGLALLPFCVVALWRRRLERLDSGPANAAVVPAGRARA